MRPRLLITAVCFLVLATLLAWRLPDRTSTVETSSPDEDPAAQIETTVRTLFLSGPTVDEKLATIDDPAGLDDLMTQNINDPRARTLTLEMQKIDITGVTAVAHIRFFLNGGAAGDYRMELDRLGGRWVAQRDSYCALIATGGPHCPSDEPTGATRPQ